MFVLQGAVGVYLIEPEGVAGAAQHHESGVIKKPRPESGLIRVQSSEEKGLVLFVLQGAVGLDRIEPEGVAGAAQHHESGVIKKAPTGVGAYQVFRLLKTGDQSCLYFRVPLAFISSNRKALRVLLSTTNPAL
ncbi:hypothetical protein [Ferrimonas kyonanensis]|uniref:hypothetical protein n=1 Tax=Ferrimonas kyonanensis TaxID=364763 RepID=UPI000480B8E7|nr:hypothetical protein [Ferrimonas kyonanensis]